jgi:hypothetical protein
MSCEYMEHPNRLLLNIQIDIYIFIYIINIDIYISTNKESIRPWYVACSVISLSRPSANAGPAQLQWRAHVAPAGEN